MLPAEHKFRIDDDEKTEIGGRAHEPDEGHIDVIQKIYRKINPRHVAPGVEEQHSAGDKDDGVKPGFERNVAAGKIAQYNDGAEHAAKEDALL